jgi:hypothetical protein
MKTLVIHPDDRSTDFLKEIYLGKGYDVITRWGISDQALTSMVETHDRIMMMGHGSPNGLIGFGHIFMNPKFIKLLQTKDTVCIWCNADKYVIPHNIRGFYTGMFISEVGEAKYFGIKVGQEVINYSNELFAQEMRRCVNLGDPKLICEGIKSVYVGDSPVFQFNNDRLYYRESTTEWNELQELLNFIPL